MVIEDSNSARMFHTVGRIPFTPEPFANFGMAGQVGMEHLHRGTSSIAVTRAINRGHSTYPEQGLEGPFLVERAAHARSRNVVDTAVVGQRAHCTVIGWAWSVTPDPAP